jgi:hypothetical protein
MRVESPQSSLGHTPIPRNIANQVCGVIGGSVTKTHSYCNEDVAACVLVSVLVVGRIVMKTNASKNHRNVVGVSITSCCIKMCKKK